MKYKILKLLFLFEVIHLFVFTLPAYAVDVTSNVSILSAESTIVGDTITISLGNEAMTVSSFTCGIQYDQERLSLVSITGVDETVPETISINCAADNSEWKALVYSTLEEAEASGNIGFAFVNSSDVAYTAGTFAKISFKVIGAGNANITVYEDSAGTDGVIAGQNEVVVCKGSGGRCLTDQITSYNPNDIATVQLVENGVVVKTIEVTSSDGEATQEFTIDNVSDGTYDLVVTKTSHLRYTIKNITVNGADVDLREKYPIVMVAGDINGDGIVGVADLGIVQNNYGKDPTSSTDTNVQNSDITGDGIIGITDIAIVQEKSNYGKQNADDPYYDNCTVYYSAE